MNAIDIDPARNLQCGDTLLNAGTLTMHVGVLRCDLTASEFQLLHVLFRQPNLLLPKAAIMDRLFDNHAKRPGEGILRVYMHRIRGHLRDLGSNLSISTRHGIGWILVAPAEA